MARATGVPGVPVVDNGWLISSNPVTGAEAGRFAVDDAASVATAVTRAHDAAVWWRSLGFETRRRRLLAWRSEIVRNLDELVMVMRAETGKPVIDATLEVTAAVEHIAWAAKHAPRVLSAHRVGGSLVQLEYSAWVEYQPYGVIGVIGPWNYPVYTPMGSIAYSLAAGNTVVFKPSEYSPAVGQFLVDAFARVAPEQPVLQAVHGTGETGAALVRSKVNKIAFTGSTNTGKRVMAAAAENLTPVLLECGGKDAMIVEADADVEAAAQAAVWAGMANAGQTCVGIERVYAVAPIYDELLEKIIAKASALKVGADPGDDIGPITMPGQIDIIERHIAAALKDGGTAMLGGPDAVRRPFVHPTVLVNVPETSTAVCEETFGPTLIVTKVRDVDEAIERTNALPYGLGGSVFGKANAMATARRMRSGMTSINSAMSFVGLPSLPFGGVGDSGFGRIHGDDGLREFARTKSIAKRRMPSVIKLLTFERKARDLKVTRLVLKALHGRDR